MHGTDSEHRPENRPTRALAGAAAVHTRSRAHLAALGRLLEDDSPKVWGEVRRRLEDAGPAAVPTLRKAARSSSASIRSRARTILTAIEKQAALRRLARYVCRDQVDLERALFLLGRHHTPRLDPRPYLRALDAMALEVTRSAHQKSSEIDRAATLVEYLGGELGYGGSQGEFHHPDNIHLHRAIERRAGMPLTLCAIYAFVARRAGLSTSFVPLPGHVMLRLKGGGDTRIVDPYHGGQVRTERDCLEYLSQNGLAFQAAWFRDAGDRLMLRRQILNLTRSAEKRGLRRDARELRVVLGAIEKQIRGVRAKPRTK